MLVAEADRDALKDWIIPKLEKISDADASVLGDYVIALVSAEETEDAVKQNCLDQLSDFLQEHTAVFIDEVIAAAKSKSYLPVSTAPKSSLLAEAAPFNPPIGPSAQQHQQAFADHSSPEQSRKRRYNERGTSVPRDGQDPHHRRGPGAERPTKQAARRGGRNGWGGPGAQMLAGAAGAMPMPPMPDFQLPPGFPQLDPTDPNFPFLAMMSMGFPGINVPGMPTPSFAGPGASGQSRGRRKRCRDYDTKGYCARGSTCPYEHGGEIVLPQTTDEYDPNQASLAAQGMNGANGNNYQGRNRAHHTANRGVRTRASFAQAGPNFDHSNTTIVVEQIPEENFSEEAVRGFFSQFGTILKVDMQAYKRLAIVEYDDYYSARAAYDSPKVIFDNRFVKVYWCKPDSLPKPPPKSNGHANEDETLEQHTHDEEMLDSGEIEKRQAEAQKAFEERQKKAQEAEARLQDIDDKLKANQEQMRALQEQLAKRSRGGLTDASTLIDQLSSLQAEAQGLNADYDTFGYRGRGRGGYRGRGSFPPRVRGYAPYRAGYRGRGYSSPLHGARSGVKRLDNRPKRIAISNIEAGSKQDEALREHLLNNYEYDSIEPAPDEESTQIITFKERYMAEMFLGQAYAIPDIGKIELAWVPNSAPTTITTSTTGKAEASGMESNQASEGDAKMDDGGAEEGGSTAAPVAEEASGPANAGDDNYDVADDEDRWMAT